MTYTKKLAIAGAALFSWLAVPAAAWAQTSYTGIPPEVQGNELRRDPKVSGTEVARTSASTAESSTVAGESTTSGTLPVTGGDLVGLTAIGLGAVGAGTFFVRRSRRTA